MYFGYIPFNTYSVMLADDVFHEQIENLLTTWTFEKVVLVCMLLPKCFQFLKFNTSLDILDKFMTSNYKLVNFNQAFTKLISFT